MSGNRTRAASLSSNITVITSGSSDASKAVTTRPRLSSQNKRVSFDAISIPLPSLAFDEAEGDASGPSSSIPPPTPIASVRGERLRAGRKPSADSVDIKAVLAAGINAWRVEIAEAETEEN
ncbi:hypothetical protein FRB94_006086 [Tulasnella sp. JGI-2019a]|nr:hypothetical protein FRB93_013239 [Tulasnella sp. JGI-2019a]KAG8999574.1 hypothetical protein FRB94_006086 [Tulasnella sp. JGI-2019a]KAG9024022.1 hypothetical protein FRB95_012207 [Tulasnella sp. JGI-2019a]